MQVVQSMETAGTSSTSGAREPPAAAAAEVVTTSSPDNRAVLAGTGRSSARGAWPGSTDEKPSPRAH
ncbi:hypothetical protein MTO96_037773 [Rhipicephalus appendiculatus]